MSLCKKKDFLFIYVILLYTKELFPCTYSESSLLAAELKKEKNTVRSLILTL